MSRVSRLLAFADREPSNPILLCDLLDELLTEGRVDEALARLRLAPAELQISSAVKFREARCALLRRDFAGVVTILQPLVAGATEVPVGITHDLAYAQLSLGSFDAAWQTLATTQAQGDDAVAVALLKARVLHHQKRYEVALDVLEPFASGPRCAEVRGLRALLLLDIGETALAAEQAEQALGADPAQYEAAIVQGTVALWEQRVDVSQAVFERVLAVDPQSGRALLGLGQVRMLHADIPAARAVLELAVARMPDHIGSWHALAWCQLLEGDLAGARHCFDRAFAIDRTFGETHGGFALVHALRGERHEAEESIKRATRLDPNGPSARYARSILLLDEGRPEEAQKIIDDILPQASRLGLAVPADFIYRLRELVRPRG
ncbi:MAG: tetratricopeptide repeat protein [Xanthomonadaceae bacterium]|nr:tetratricopeptide repeat protein [Xanthomonadaceae bacterium]